MRTPRGQASVIDDQSIVHWTRNSLAAAPACATEVPSPPRTTDKTTLGASVKAFYTRQKETDKQTRRPRGRPTKSQTKQARTTICYSCMPQPYAYAVMRHKQVATRTVIVAHAYLFTYLPRPSHISVCSRHKFHEIVLLV